MDEESIRQTNDEDESANHKTQKLYQLLPEIIGYILDSKVKEGDALAKKAKNPNTYFSQKTAPNIGIKDYLKHLMKCFQTPPAVLILCMIYVERFLSSLSNAVLASGSAYPYLLTSKNAHKIVLASLLIAHKYSMDVKYPFSIVSKMAGVTDDELKLLESEFLTFVSYELYVSQDIYEKYLTSIEQFGVALNLQQQVVSEEHEYIMHEANAIYSESTLFTDESFGRRNQKEERKDETEAISRVGFKQALAYTDEHSGYKSPTYFEKDIPNVASPHYKIYQDVVRSPCIFSDSRSNYFEASSSDSQSDQDDEDTEMTIIDVDDLEDDYLPGDVILS